MTIINQQLATIGHPSVSNISKGQAVAMLDEIFANMPATPKRWRYLRFLGVEYRTDIAKPEASRLIDQALTNTNQQTVA